MRVRIDYSVDVDTEYRRAVNHYYGRPGMATREELKQWFWSHGTSMDDEVLSQLEDIAEEEDELAVGWP